MSADSIRGVTAGALILDERLSDGDFGFDLEHWFCQCSRDLALCGADLTGDPETEAIESDDDCVVCVDLLDVPCERCGDA